MKIITHAEDEYNVAGWEIDRFPQRAREGGRKGGREEGREEGRQEGEGGSNCGVVLVVNIYYKLWKERHRTHNNGQRLVYAQLVHKWSTSVQ